MVAHAVTKLVVEEFCPFCDGVINDYTTENDEDGRQVCANCGTPVESPGVDQKKLDSIWAVLHENILKWSDDGPKNEGESGPSYHG